MVRLLVNRDDGEAEITIKSNSRECEKDLMTFLVNEFLYCKIVEDK